MGFLDSTNDRICGSFLLICLASLALGSLARWMLPSKGDAITLTTGGGASVFRRPRARPYPQWSIEHTKPLPYRPFRWGAYHITLGLRKMDWDEWIELDNHYGRYHEEKARRIAERGIQCCRTDRTPQASEAALELLHELSSYLSERYPSMFHLTSQGIVNVATAEEFDLRPSQFCINGGGREDPMQLAARMVQDDLAIMVKGDDGQYYLRAGAILLPGFWRLQDKWGMSLSEIHASGHVPGFQERLERGMRNLFTRLKPEDPVTRNNYFFQLDDSLGWSSSIGSEDSDQIGWFTARESRTIQNIHLRTERQTLRRLPRSGAIVFTIRTYCNPVTEIAEEQGVPGRMASAVRSWGEDVSRYKGRDRYEGILVRYLDRKHQEQIKAGLLTENEIGRVTYPW